MREGDINKIHADINKAKKLIGYKPKITLNEGLSELIIKPTR